MSRSYRALFVSSPILLALVLIVIVAIGGSEPGDDGNWAMLGVVVYAPIWLPVTLGLCALLGFLTRERDAGETPKETVGAESASMG